MPVYFYTYTHNNYLLQDIKTKINIDGLQATHMYLSATRKLERDHGNRSNGNSIQTLADTWQKKVDRQDNTKFSYVCMFKKAIRLWFETKKLLVFSGTQERILFRRAVDEVSKGNIAQKKRLLLDEKLWLEAFERGCLHDHNVKDLVLSPKIADVYSELWSAFKIEQNKNNNENAANRYSFAERLHSMVQMKNFWPKHIIMEGFSVLRPMQKYWMEALEKNGCTFHIILPYRNKHPAYTIIENLYSFWYPYFSKRNEFSVPQQTHSRLDLLDSELFTNITTPPSKTSKIDTSVVIQHFPFQQEEIQFAIDWICKHKAPLLHSQTDHTNTPNLMIVTKRREHFIPMLLEEIRRRKLNIPIKQNIASVLFHPLGRFILAVYQCYRDGALYLEAKTFREIIQSNFLQQNSEPTRYLFDRFMYPYVQKCTTDSEWTTVWQNTEHYITNNRGISASDIISHITPTILSSWKNTYNTFKGIVEKIHNDKKNGSLQEKASKLQQVIKGYRNISLQEEDQIILANIIQHLQDLEDNGDLHVSTKEFGEMLLGVIKEDEEDTSNEEIGIGLSIVGPESTEGISVPHILVLGCDDIHFPRKFQHAWPFKDASLQEHIYTERFLFHSVVRAAHHSLTFTWSQFENDSELRPSPYIREIIDRLHEEQNLREVRLEEGEPVVQTLIITTKGLPQEIPLEDIAQYRLCPYRYYLAQQEPWRKSPNTSFETRFQLHGPWLQNIYLYYQSQNQNKNRWKKADKENLFDKAITDANNKLQTQYTGYTQPELREIQSSNAFFLHYYQRKNFYQRYVAKGNVLKQLETIPPRSIPFASTRVKFPQTYKIHKQCNQLQREEIQSHIPVYMTFGKFGNKPPIEDDYDPAEFYASPVAPNLYDACHWLSQIQIAYNTNHGDWPKKKNEYQKGITVILSDIKQGKFSKRPGTHCVSCPMRSPCYGDIENMIAIEEDISALESNVDANSDTDNSDNT